MTNAQHPTSAPDAKAEVRRAVASLKENAPDAGSTTSDLSIDEAARLWLTPELREPFQAGIALAEGKRGRGSAGA